MGWHVGVAGTGQWSRVHLAALAAHRQVDRITLAGRNEAARQELAGRFPKVQATAADHRALCDDPSIELVHVVVPHHLHAEVALAALAAGKHVICEKPGATRLKEFDRLRQAAATNHRKFLVVLNQRYNPIARRVRELIDEGSLGRVFLSVENAFSDASRNYRNPHAWRTTKALAGGGILIDGGFHMVYRHLDYLASYGRPAWVLADTPQLAVTATGEEDSAKGEDFISVTIGFAAPLRIQWSHAWTLAATPERSRQCFIAGSEATLELADRDEEPLVLLGRDSRAVIDVPPGPTSPADTTQACLGDYLDHLAAGTEPTWGSLDLARTSLAVILAAYESGRSGQRIAMG